jgi:hypothetical protein
VSREHPLSCASNREDTKTQSTGALCILQVYFNSMTGADCAVSCLWSQLCGIGALSSKADTTSAALKAGKHHSVRNWGALKSRTLPARALSRRVPRTRIADSSLPVRQFLGSTFGPWESQTLWNHQTHAGASKCNSVIAALSTLTEAQAGEGASTARKVEKFWEWLKENGALEGGKPLVRIAEVRHLCPYMQSQAIFV